MILLGDLHATNKNVVALLDALDAYVREHNVQDVICMGDIVYQFSYDRHVIVLFFRLIKERSDAGYTVHVLAGNHDWIANHYIYEELALIHAGTSPIFYMQPAVVEIEGVPTLMLPYNMSLRSPPQSDSILSGEDVNVSIGDGGHDNDVTRVDRLNVCIESWLERFAVHYRGIRCVIHHYYIGDTLLPGMRGVFTKKDPIIPRRWVGNDECLFVSGHMHHGFWLRNILCTGALWDVMGRHPNVVTCVLQLSWSKRVLHITPFFGDGIHIRLDDNVETTHEPLTRTHIMEHIEQLYAACVKYYTQHIRSGRSVVFQDAVKPMLSMVQLDISSKHATYETRDTYIDDTTSDALRTMRFVREMDRGAVVERLETDHRNLTTSFRDRKKLLHDYLQERYPKDIDRYLSIMKKKKLL